MDYLRPTTFAASLGHQPVQVVTKPGFSSWDRVTPASALLAGHAKPGATDQVLCLACSHGALGVALARQAPEGHVRLMDPSFPALQMAERTLAANAVPNAGLAELPFVPPNEAGQFDLVTLEIPKSRPLARRWLLEARDALRTGGSLVLAGPNDSGIQSIARDAEALFGPALVLAVREHNRVVRLTRQDDDVTRHSADPAWSREPGIASGTWCEFDLTLRGRRFRIRSLPGVFSYDRLDEGSALLVEHLTVPAGGRVLDLGCGYGVLGLAVTMLGAGAVDLVDSDLLAVAAASETLRQNGVQNARALPSDAGSAVAGQRYDLIVTNPPFHAAKSVDTAMARAFFVFAAEALNPRGEFWLVANRFLAYEPLLRERFSRVERVAENGRFQVIRCVSRPGSGRSR